MKLFDIKAKPIINGRQFYIRPFPAYKSINISGELLSTLVPMVSAATPIIMGVLDEDEKSFLDIDFEKFIPNITTALASLNGDKLEYLLKRLLTDYGTISFDRGDSPDPIVLTEDEANNIFCDDPQDMFILAKEVILANYNGFFKKLATLSGLDLEKIAEKGLASSKNMGSSILNSFQN